MKTSIFRSYNIFLRRKGLMPSGIHYYESFIDQFFRFTGAHISDFGDKKRFTMRYDRLLNRTISNETRKKYLKCARIFADFLQTEKIIKVNAPRKIDAPRVQTSLPIPIEDEDIINIFQAVNRLWTGFFQYRNTIIIKTFLYTGLRRAELLNLKREYINEERIFVKGGKGNKDRVVFIPKHFYEELDNYMRKTAGVNEYLFFSSRKNKMSERAISRIFDQIKQETGMKSLHPHKMRHTYASRVLEQGISLAVLRDQLGHTNIATTNRYITVRDSHRKQAIQSLAF